MSHEAGSAFWEAALKDFPRLPHLSEIEIIYDYRTHRSFNTSCWDRFNSILSDRHTLPCLRYVDICPAIKSQRLEIENETMVFDALSSIESLGLLLTHWGD